MRIVFLQANKVREQNIADAFVAGLRRHGVRAEKMILRSEESLPAEVDAVCMFGVKSRKLWDWYRRAGIQIIYFDKGYVRRGPHSSAMRISVNSHHPTRWLMSGEQPADRFRRMEVDVEPWRESGSQVVVVGSSAKYHEFHGLLEPTEYATRLIKRIGKWTNGRQIIYRPKPSWDDAVPIDGSTFAHDRQITIESLLKGAHALITHGSSACFEAMLAGVPSVILGDAVARPISSTNLEEIEAPLVATDEDRQRLLANLAYWQWTLPEMEAGTAWDFLRHHLGKPPADPVYATMCRLLARGHGRRGLAPEDTLNRLFWKSYDGDDPPELAEDNVTVTLERYPIGDLVKLARPVGEDEYPASMRFPVTIVRHGRDYLIDGSKRIARWAAEGRETAEAYVVRVL